MSAKIDRPLYVLDTSALLALFHSEPGWKIVEAALGESVVCAVNLTETITKLTRKGGEPRLVERYLRGLPMPILPWDEALAWESRDMARHLGAAAMTSDAEWAKLDLDVRVILFRQGKCL